MVVGSNIKILREYKNITQKDLAKKLGVSRQALCMWEADKRGLKTPILTKIAKIFEIPVDYLLNPIKMSQLKENKGVNMAKGTQTTNKKSQKINKVEFHLKAPDAKKVILTGDFVDWKQDGITMKKNRLGMWSTSLDCKPGRYEYKFIVDNEWWTDPANNQTVTTPFGSKNSIKEV